MVKLGMVKFIKDGTSDNKVKYEQIYTSQPIILCYMDIAIHPRLKKYNN